MPLSQSLQPFREQTAVALLVRGILGIISSHGHGEGDLQDSNCLVYSLPAHLFSLCPPYFLGTSKVKSLKGFRSDCLTAPQFTSRHLDCYFTQANQLSYLLLLVLHIFIETFLLSPLLCYLPWELITIFIFYYVICAFYC